MDSVEIRGLYCRCIIGIRARERRVAQRVRLDLDLQVDLERAGKSGRIAHTVDYSRASSELIALLQFRRYSLLEMAAEECAAWLFAAHPLVRAVSLTLSKPQALVGQAESGGVRISRARPPEGEHQATPFGSLQTQLETAEATLSVLGLDPGATLRARDLGARQALLLPLSARLEGERPLSSHEPHVLAADASCTNRDSARGLLVVCALRLAG